MTVIKLASKLGGNASVALHEIVSPLYNNLGMRIVGVVELAAVERAQPAPDEDKDASVTVAVKHIEIARGDQEHHLRQAMAALHRQRTAVGTLDDGMEVTLSERTVERCSGVLDAVEASRLRAALLAHSDYIHRVLMGDLTLTQAKEELRTVQRGLEAATGWGRDGIN